MQLNCVLGLGGGERHKLCALPSIFALKVKCEGRICPLILFD